MKKIYKSIFYIAAFLPLCSCTSGFDEMNQDPYTVSDKTMQSGGVAEVLANHCSVMEGIVIPTQENLYQYMNSLGCAVFSGYMGQTKHTDLGRYIYNVGFIGYPFTDEQSLPKLIKEYNALTLNTKGDKSNPFFALGTIMKVSVMQHLTDLYGPVPYNFGGTSAQKPFQSEETVYREMIQDLTWSIQTLKDAQLLKTEKEAWATVDKVYNGNISLWIRYAASLKLRLSMRCSGVIPEEAKKWAEEAVNDGVLEDNSQIAQLQTNDNTLVKMCKDWGDTRVGADIVSYMVAYDDPRLGAYFTKTNRGGNNTYFGLRAGVVKPEKETLTKEGLYSMTTENSNSPMVWMTPAEVYFLRSEGALKGWKMGNTAEYFYKKGIQTSMEQHKVEMGSYLSNTNKRGSFTDAKFPDFNNEEFHSNIVVKWNDSDKEANLAQIITQKYIAMFPYGSPEAWAEWRRTGYPNLLPPKDYNHDVTATVQNSAGRDTYGYRRYPLPLIEYTVNSSNTEEAVKNFLHGQDTPNTNPWWALKY